MTARCPRVSEEETVTVTPDLDVAAHDHPDGLSSRLANFDDQLGHGTSLSRRAALNRPVS
jgi:hypothetical protein